MTTDTHLDADTTTYVGRPRFEGANIRTWIGFKHFTYLLEEGVLQYLRDRDLGPTKLYREFGLGVEFVDSSIQLPNTIDLDDEVTVHVTRDQRKLGWAFAVRMTVDRGDGPITVLNGKTRVQLIHEVDTTPGARIPDSIADAVSEITPLDTTGPQTLAQLKSENAGAFLWSWRIPYFYCHYSLRLQHSGYVRAVEEVVDRFLFDRGLAIEEVLAERGWIPVVSRSRITLLEDALMGETLHTVMRVDEVIKDVMYPAKIDTYVERGGTLFHTATASVVHGYAVSRGADAGTLAVFDDETRSKILGEQ